MLFDSSNDRLAREREMRAAGRLPPGQSLTLKWPVLHAGSVPQFNPMRTWEFRIFGLVDGTATAFLGRIFQSESEISAGGYALRHGAGAGSTITGAACWLRS